MQKKLGGQKICAAYKTKKKKNMYKKKLGDGRFV